MSIEQFLMFLLLLIPFCLNILLPRIIKKMTFGHHQSLMSFAWIKAVVVIFVIGCSFGGFITTQELLVHRGEGIKLVLPLILTGALLLIGFYPVFSQMENESENK